MFLAVLLNRYCGIYHKGPVLRRLDSAHLVTRISSAARRRPTEKGEKSDFVNRSRTNKRKIDKKKKETSSQVKVSLAHKSSAGVGEWRNETDFQDQREARTPCENGHPACPGFAGFDRSRTDNVHQSANRCVVTHRASDNGQQHSDSA